MCPIYCFAIKQSLSSSTKQQNLFFASAFVKMSDTLLSVGMYVTWIFLSSMASRMKWYWISICLVCAWNLLSLDNAIEPLGCCNWLLTVHFADHVFPLGSYTTTRLPWPHEFVWYTQPRYSIMQWCIASSSSRIQLLYPYGISILRLSAGVSGQPNLRCNTPRWGS